ncbi:MAG TPA: sulfite exporter TauE/SafE family protein, partial [bacterium]|nr:sulfite exporter TauE/SafE family protein [bacterium]
MIIIGYILLGLISGIISGLIGLGGGTVILPALVFIFGMNQHLAQGTTLALMIPPIGLLAAIEYYKAGYVNFKAALFICIGFFIGGLIGSKFAMQLSDEILQKIFGCFLFI